MRLAAVGALSVTALAGVGCTQWFGLEAPVLADAAAADIESIEPCATLSQACAGPDVLRTCTAIGELPIDSVCVWGCVDTSAVDMSSARCGKLVPSGGSVVTADLDAMATLAAIDLHDATSFASDGSIVSNLNGTNTTIRGAGPGVVSGIDYEVRDHLVLFRFGSLHISGTVFLFGVTKPLALVADGEISLEGSISAVGLADFGYGSFPGPGGVPGGGAGVSAAGSAGGAGGGADVSAGGGGAGNGGSGGKGGITSGTGPAGGATFGDAAITVLAGGGGGGGGGGASGGTGGGGGGAIQLASNTRVTIASTGGINAGGVGGNTGVSGYGGGGGGAGGTILIEAPAIEIAGTLAVNGGGGGAGGGAGSGTSGGMDREPAPGGIGSGTNGSGANGAAGAVVTGATAVNATHAGGGGGAVGRIRLNTHTGDVSVAITGTLSPGLDDPNTTCTKGIANTH